MTPASAAASAGRALAAPALALLVTLVAGDLLMLAVGQAPGPVWSALLGGTWGNAYGLGQVLYKATVLTCTGLSVAVGLRAGLFNVGAEGQLAVGGFAAGVAGMFLPADTPGVVAAALLILAATAGGAAAGAVPGILKARFGAHEVITTILLNFILLALLDRALNVVRVPETMHTPAVRAGTLPRLSGLLPALHGSAASAAVVLALLAAMVTFALLFGTRAGLELRAVGLAPDAAEAAGIRPPRVWLSALTASGALAGLGSTAFVLGYKGYYEEGFGGGAGFMGIAVALVGESHPGGVLLSALLFATLSQGGLAVSALVPRSLTDVLEAVAILALAGSSPAVRRALRMR